MHQHRCEILLVEDDLETLRTIAFLLRRSGYQVETAQTVAEAEPLLEPGKVLVCDIGLPDGSGWDLMTRFKAGGGRFGVAISGFGEEHDIERSRGVGFADHLVKPIDFDALRSSIEALESLRS